MAVGSAASAATIAALRLSVRTLLAPNLYFFFFSALDASLAHFSVVLDLGLRELAVLPEDDVETKPEDTQSDEYKCCKKYFHPDLS